MLLLQYLHALATSMTYNVMLIPMKSRGHKKSCLIVNLMLVYKEKINMQPNIIRDANLKDMKQ
jgi:hypothetical protein